MDRLIQSFIFFALGALTGPVYDLGHLRLLIVVGSFCIVFGHMMLSLCQEYWQIVLAQGFVVGAGGGCLFVPALAVVQPYFSTRLGMALGIIGTGSSDWMCGVRRCVYQPDRPCWFRMDRTHSRLPVTWHALHPHHRHANARQASGCPKTAGHICIYRQHIHALHSRVLPWVGGCQVSFFYIAFYGEVKGWLAGILALYVLPIVNAGSIIGRVLPNILAIKIGPVNVIVPGSYASIPS